MFFFPWKKKVPVKAIFGHFFDFFTGKKTISRPLFALFYSFFTPTFSFSRAFFSFFFVFFRFFHGEEINFHGHKFDCIRGKVTVFTGYFSNFFHVHQLEFHGHDFCKISRASLPFHGDFFKVFQTFSRAFFFHGQHFRFFSRVRFRFSLEKKNTAPRNPSEFPEFHHFPLVCWYFRSGVYRNYSEFVGISRILEFRFGRLILKA